MDEAAGRTGDRIIDRAIICPIGHPKGDRGARIRTGEQDVHSCTLTGGTARGVDLAQEPDRSATRLSTSTVLDSEHKGFLSASVCCIR